MDKLIQAEIDALKEATREAHAAIKDLKKAQREAEAMIKTMIADKIEATIDEAVKAGLEGYREALAAAIDKSTKATFDRFDTLANIMIGKGKPGDLEALAARIAAREKN